MQVGRIRPEGSSVSFTPHHVRGQLYAEFFADERADSFIDTYSVAKGHNLSEEIFLEGCSTIAHLIANGANHGQVAAFVPELQRR